MTNDANLLNQKAIIWFKCCTNGKTIGQRKDIPPHMFIILTNKNYNDSSEDVCGTPITSKKDKKIQNFLLNYGVNITDDEIEGEDGKTLVLEKESFILCDRPVRLNKSDLSPNQKHIGRVKQEKFDHIIFQIQNFLKRGKIIQKRV